MKRYLLLFVAVITMFVGCTKDVDLESTINIYGDGPTFEAAFADSGTRTFLDEDVKLLWTAEDQLSIFLTTLNEKYQFNGRTGDNSGIFSHIKSGQFGTGNELSTNYAVYPYDESITISNSEVISLTLPATQKYAPKSFGLGANTMVAVTDGPEDYFLPFKNLGGYLKLKLYGDNITVKSIELVGGKSEKISGAATVSAEYGKVPELSMSDDATSTITLDCGDGVLVGSTKETATEFWLVVPPTTFENGFIISIEEVGGGVCTRMTTKNLEVERNTVLSMEAFKLDYTMPANEIWYTTINGEPIDETQIGDFGATVSSNTYAGGKGVIKFDNDITQISNLVVASEQTPDTNLSSVTIPQTVSTIGRNAFQNCAALSCVTILSGITTSEISTYATRAQSDGITEIADGAFRRCLELKNFNIPNGVIKIGRNAFQDCSNLHNVKIPDSVTEIGLAAFSSCINLKHVKLSKNITVIPYSLFQLCKNLKHVELHEGITTIDGNAFGFCSSLKTINIPESVTEIGSSNPFKGCNNLSFSGKYASDDGHCLIKDGEIISFVANEPIDFVIPDDLKITSTAFWECENIKSVTVPDNINVAELLDTYPYNPFMLCANLKEFKGKYASTDGRCLVYDGHILSYALGSGTEYTIPSDITSIGQSAFKGSVNLEKVTIPETVTSVGSAAFSNCENLKIVDFRANVSVINGNMFQDSGLVEFTVPNTVTEIKNNAFARCYQLKKITIPNSVTSVGNWLFLHCATLEGVELPNSLTAISDFMFVGCQFKSIVIPNSVESIGLCAFWDNNSGNSKLESVVIGDGVKTIGSMAFESCLKLKNVTIGDNVETIEAQAFEHCAIESITLPASVKSIGSQSFNCPNLKTVFCKPMTPPVIQGFPFGGGIENVYVPTESVDTYTSSWDFYSDKIVGITFTE